MIRSSRVALLLLVALAASARAQLAIDSLTGPVTPHEIAAFKGYIGTLSPPAANFGNVWVYGNPGKQLEGMGLMYEVTHDRAILDRMVEWSDTALAGRDDLASAAQGGQLRAWTGQVEPIWPSSRPGQTPAGAGIEQGQVLSHLIYCARLILQNPALWKLPVTAGDPHGFGATYKARALTYIREGDAVIDRWILPHFIRAAENNHFYFPGAPNTYKPNDPAPWNQLFMLTNGLVRLTECHVLLGDDPARVARYDAIVRPNLEWFLQSSTSRRSAAGTDCRLWAYALPHGMEDTNHAAYDSEGLWIAFDSGRYGLTRAQLLPYANTYVDVVLATVAHGRFAGRVDGTTGVGHGGGDDYVRDEYLYLSEFRPDAFVRMGEIEIHSRKVANSLPITARLLWEKDRRSR